MSRPWYKHYTLWLFLLLLPQLLGMILLPFAGTSEPRYAEIARLMAESGDWITPWFEPGIPFWGKPPFSFWLQALSIQQFGLSEWAVRLPSWVSFIAVMAIIYAIGRAYANVRAARWSVIIFLSCALPYIAGVAVLTDPFLLLGTSLTMAGLILTQWYWRVLGFIGLAIGLLAKGPLAAVLIVGSIITGWLLSRQRQWPRLNKYSWLGGMALVTALVLPWYLLAELKTPGFLHYFLIGEHILRYLDSGWQGDLYGSAHVQPYGSIWLFWLMATFPWGLLAIALLSFTISSQTGRQRLRQAIGDRFTAYLLGWSVFTLLLFTFASNLLWTYVLPAIPAFAILLGKSLSVWQEQQSELASPRRHITIILAVLVPVAMLLLSLAVTYQPSLINSERELVRYVQNNTTEDHHLWYINSRPFSARYYSRGNAEQVPIEQVETKLKRLTGAVYMAIPKKQFEQIQAQLPAASQRIDITSKKYILLRVPSHISRSE